MSIISLQRLIVKRNSAIQLFLSMKKIKPSYQDQKWYMDGEILPERTVFAPDCSRSFVAKPKIETKLFEVQQYDMVAKIEKNNILYSVSSIEEIISMNWTSF